MRAATQLSRQRCERKLKEPLEEIIKLVGQITELLKTMDERQDFRLTVIERKLGIPTGTNALAGAHEQESVSEQSKRLIEALLQPTPPAPMPVVACWLLLWRAKRERVGGNDD